MNTNRTGKLKVQDILLMQIPLQTKPAMHKHIDKEFTKKMDLRVY